MMNAHMIIGSGGLTTSNFDQTLIRPQAVFRKLRFVVEDKIVLCRLINK
jgi:hypothetical protein